MVDTIFDAIRQSAEKMEFTVKSSMLEIYNEKIRDLLDPSKDNLGVHEDKQRGIYVDGLTETSMGTELDVYELMKEGNANRAIAETKMNAQSSRSHSIFILTLTMNDTENLACKTGKLYLVDLAGSEMISKTGASGQTLEEAKNINKSLTMLGRVITALTDGKSQHIPYRDSKLTRILQESLGGNAKTCLIVTASPSMYNAVETLSTCRFGIRAKSIKNNAKVNKQVTLAELKVAITKLEKELVLKNTRIQQLESFLISKGLIFEAVTLNINDHNLESQDQHPVDNEMERVMQSDDMEPKLHTELQNGGKEDSMAVVKGQDRLSVCRNLRVSLDEGSKATELLRDKNPGRELERKDSIDMLNLYKQISEQNDIVPKSLVEQQKAEQENDIDTLLERLRQERNRTKAKEEKIRMMKEELMLKNDQVELAKSELNEIEKQFKAKEYALEVLKKELEEKVDLEVTPKSGSESVDWIKVKEEFLKQLLADQEIDAEMKEKIARKGNNLLHKSVEGEPLDVLASIPQKEETHEERKLKEENGKLRKKVKFLQTKLLCEKEFSMKKVEAKNAEIMKRKIKILEKTMEQLSKQYYDHLNKITYLKFDREMKEKELRRKTRKLDEKDKQIAKLREDLRHNKAVTDQLKRVIWENMPNAEEILSQPMFTNVRAFCMHPTNVVKVLQGGNLLLKVRQKEQYHPITELIK
jgi:kinesin family protein 5